MTGSVFYNLNRPGRAVRVVSLGPCSACIINLQPNILLKKVLKKKKKNIYFKCIFLEEFAVVQ